MTIAYLLHLIYFMILNFTRLLLRPPSSTLSPVHIRKFSYFLDFLNIFQQDLSEWVLSEKGRWTCQLEGDCPEEELYTAEDDTPDRYDHKVLPYVEYRAVSGVFRTIDLPPPLQYFGRRQTFDWPHTV
jgi:hypothetical protein